MVRKILKWAGIVVGVLVGLVVIALATIYFSVEIRLNRTYTFTPEKVEVPTDAASIAEGKRQVTMRGCSVCHGPDLAGRAMIDDPKIAIVYAANLTSGKGGVGATFTTDDWTRAILHGVKPDGKTVVIMPAWEFWAGMTNAQLGDVIAYLKSLPPVDRVIPERQIAFPIRAAIALGQLDASHFFPGEGIDHSAQRPAPVPVAETAEYGKTLAIMCTSCHNPDFTGGPVKGRPPTPGEPDPQNITPDKTSGIGKWTKDDFFKAIHEGVRPDGSKLSNAMPWENFKLMTDTELGAVWAYLQSLPPRPYGSQ